MVRRARRRAPHCLTLPELLDLRQAAPLAASLLTHRGKDVVVDAASVRRLGGQCLQVLLAARASWEADGKSFRISAASEHFVATLALFGAGDLAPGDPAHASS